MNLRPDAILVPTVKHTGTRYLLSLLGNSKAKLRNDGEVDRGSNYNLVHSHFDKRTEHIRRLSKSHKTVIPLRHPAFVAVSWKKRKQGSFLKEWLNICEGFYFPLETKPFDELEDYVGFELNRHQNVLNSIGEYPEKHSLDAARQYLGDLWSDVEVALDTDIAKQFYP